MDPNHPTPHGCYDTLCSLPDPQKTVGLLSELHISLLLQHLSKLPSTGVPGVLRALVEQRAIELMRDKWREGES